MIGEHLYPQSELINGAVIQKKRGRFKLAFWLKVISCYLTLTMVGREPGTERCFVGFDQGEGPHWKVAEGETEHHWVRQHGVQGSHRRTETATRWSTTWKILPQRLIQKLISNIRLRSYQSSEIPHYMVTLYFFWNKFWSLWTCVKFSSFISIGVVPYL